MRRAFKAGMAGVASLAGLAPETPFGDTFKSEYGREGPGKRLTACLDTKLDVAA